MIPGLDEARAIFTEDHPGCDWELFLKAWERQPSGYVNEPENGLLLMAEPRVRNDTNEWAWFVWYACGPIPELMARVPPLPWVVWGRRKTKRLHFTRWDRIRSLTMKGSH